MREGRSLLSGRRVSGRHGHQLSFAALELFRTWRHNRVWEPNLPDAPHFRTEMRQNEDAAASSSRRVHVLAFLFTSPPLFSLFLSTTALISPQSSPYLPDYPHLLSTLAPYHPPLRNRLEASTASLAASRSPPRRTISLCPPRSFQHSLRNTAY